MKEESLPVMPHKDPEVARAYRKANAERRNENSKRWKASLTPEQLEAYNACARKRREDDPERYRKYESTKRLKHREAILKRKRDYHHRNRERELKRMRESAAQNREQRRSSCAKWYAVNRAKALTKASRYYEVNRISLLAKRESGKPAKSKIQCPQCGTMFVERRRNRDRFCSRKCHSAYNLHVYSSNLRAAKLKSSGTFTDEQWDKLKECFGWECAYCGTYTRKLTIEHVEPLARGGLHDELNIVPACRSCNSRKQASNLIEFLFLRPLTSKSRTRAKPGF